MTPDQKSMLDYTVRHFQEIARQNRFPENATIDHDTARCAVCHPELLPMDPFATYLEVVTQSVKIRRPRLDATLVDEINNDLALVGDPARVSLVGLQSKEPESVCLWADWLRGALSTGLELLSVHCGACREFYLDEAEAAGFEDLIRQKVEEIMAFQTSH